MFASASYNAERGRGSIQNWLYDYEHQEEQAHQIPRCPSAQGLINFNHAKKGTIKPLVEGELTPRPDSCPPRIKPEGECIAGISRGRRMGVLINKYAQSGPTPRQPRVKSEGKSTSELHKGGRFKSLVYDYGRLPLSSRPVPRVKSAAEAIAHTSKGGRMKTTLHRLNTMPLSARAVPRIKIEAKDTASMDRGKRMDNLIHSYGQYSVDKAVPRVKIEGEDYARLGMGGRMSTLLHDIWNYPSPARGVPRVRLGDASNILYRSRGTVGKMLRQSGEKSLIYRPGEQSRQYYRPRMM